MPHTRRLAEVQGRRRARRLPGRRLEAEAAALALVQAEVAEEVARVEEVEVEVVDDDRLLHSGILSQLSAL